MSFAVSRAPLHAVGHEGVRRQRISYVHDKLSEVKQIGDFFNEIDDIVDLLVILLPP